MKQLEMEIWERACASKDEIDVGALHDENIASAIQLLAARGYIEIYLGGNIRATNAGRIALEDYHQRLKDASKQETQQKAQRREDENKRLIGGAVKEVADFVLRHL